MEPASGMEPPAYGLRNRSKPEDDSNSKTPPNKETDDLEQNSD